MNWIRNIKFSLRIIISFGATGLLLVFLTLYLGNRIDQDSARLSEELTRYENLNRTLSDLSSSLVELESIPIANVSTGVTADPQLTDSKFGQELVAAETECEPGQLRALQEIRSLGQQASAVRIRIPSEFGKNKQRSVDSLNEYYAAMRSNLSSCLSMAAQAFYESHTASIESISSLKDGISYTAYALILVIAAVGLFWYRSLTSPLRSLMDATRKITDGAWGTRVNLNSQNEFGKLGESFDEMSEVIARLVACLNEVGNPVYSIDKRFVLQFANNAALKFANAKQEEVVLKKKCYEVFRLPLCNTDGCPVKRAWEEERMITGESIARPQNAPIPVLVQAAPVSEMGAEVTRGVEVLTDISTMKKVASEIEADRKYLSDNVNLLLEKMTQFAEGDLTLNLAVEKSDDVGKLAQGFNNLVDNIKGIIEQLIDAVESTARASGQIGSSIEELAAGVSEQSGQANDVAASVEQMTKSVTDNAKNAARVELAARENGKVARDGGEIVQKTVAKMKEIADVVGRSSATVNQLGDLSSQISEIISVIGDIADQTNLLALNAAIEAARAGEEGRGFAVVADEVRKLAERTTQATKQISSMIKNVQKSTGEAVTSMQNGIREVTAGLVLADQAGISLNEIVGNAHGIVDMVSQIAAANEEQSTTSGEISRNAELISTVSSQSASGISQIARAADDLNRLTGNLQNLIARFKLAKDKNIDLTPHFGERIVNQDGLRERSIRN